MSDEARGPEVITQEEIERHHQRLLREAEAAGYHLNPDVDFARLLARGLLINARRHGYQACPCRLSTGVPAEDRDIVCPCDYRDDDLDEHGVCYCGLYVSGAVARGEQEACSIPERRMPADQRRQGTAAASPDESEVPAVRALPHPVWRCQVCGYLCARTRPPEICPICRAGRERFERFM